jgi:hypothetical protein
MDKENFAFTFTKNNHNYQKNIQKITQHTQNKNILQIKIVYFIITNIMMVFYKSLKSDIL